MFNKILLASDSSEPALRAVKAAIELCRLNPEATVDVINIVPPIPPQWYTYYPAEDIDIPAFIQKTGEEALADSLKLFEEAGIQVNTIIESGDAAEEICDVAQEGNYDLIIVGRRGIGPIRELALGSVSNKICHRAKCPVLVVN